jgi:hypothetical protein
MARDFLSLQDEALADDFDSSKYRARVKKWLNEARGRVRRRIEMADAESTQDIALVAGQREYTLPSDQVRLASAFLLSPYTALPEVDSDELDPGTTASGQASRFALRGSTLIVDPPPSSSGTLRVRYWSDGSEMTADTDSHGIPEDYEDLLITFARSRLFRAEDDIEMATFYMNEFHQELALARGDLQRRSENRARQTPGTWARPATPRFVRP